MYEAPIKSVASLSVIIASQDYDALSMRSYMRAVYNSGLTLALLQKREDGRKEKTKNLARPKTITSSEPLKLQLIT